MGLIPSSPAFGDSLALPRFSAGLLCLHRGLLSRGSSKGKGLRRQCRWGNTFPPFGTVLGWFQQPRGCTQSSRSQLRPGVDSLGLVLRGNCRDSQPTAAQQRGAAEGREASHLTNISAECFHNSFLPLASSGLSSGSPWPLRGLAKGHTCLCSQASFSSTGPNSAKLAKCYRKQKSH